LQAKTDPDPAGAIGPATKQSRAEQSRADQACVFVGCSRSSWPGFIRRVRVTTMESWTVLRPSRTTTKAKHMFQEYRSTGRPGIVWTSPNWTTKACPTKLTIV